MTRILLLSLLALLWASLSPCQAGVLCCCRTLMGGTCCAEVSYCSGTYVPGCMCSPF